MNKDAQMVLEALEKLSHERYLNADGSFHQGVGYCAHLAKQALPAAQRLVEGEKRLAEILASIMNETDIATAQHLAMQAYELLPTPPTTREE